MLISRMTVLPYCIWVQKTNLDINEIGWDEMWEVFSLIVCVHLNFKLTHTFNFTYKAKSLELQIHLKGFFSLISLLYPLSFNTLSVTSFKIRLQQHIDLWAWQLELCSHWIGHILKASNFCQREFLVCWNGLKHGASANGVPNILRRLIDGYDNCVPS